MKLENMLAVNAMKDLLYLSDEIMICFSIVSDKLIDIS